MPCFFPPTRHTLDLKTKSQSLRSIWLGGMENADFREAWTNPRAELRPWTLEQSLSLQILVRLLIHNVPTGVFIFFLKGQGHTISCASWEKCLEANSGHLSYPGLPSWHWARTACLTRGLGICKTTEPDCPKASVACHKLTHPRHLERHQFPSLGYLRKPSIQITLCV